MMEYTPSWESLGEESEPVPEDQLYGSGLNHTSPWEKQTPERERTPSRELMEAPHWGPERHPSLSLLSGDYYEELVDHELQRSGCGCGGYVITAEGAEFPPEESLRLYVYGVREGDTAVLDVSVEAANPLTIRVPEECGTLYRYWATGCLCCRGDEE